MRYKSEVEYIRGLLKSGKPVPAIVLYHTNYPLHRVLATWHDMVRSGEIVMLKTSGLWGENVGIRGY